MTPSEKCDKAQMALADAIAALATCNMTQLAMQVAEIYEKFKEHRKCPAYNDGWGR